VNAEEQEQKRKREIVKKMREGKRKSLTLRFGFVQYWIATLTVGLCTHTIFGLEVDCQVIVLVVVPPPTLITDQ
jgi:hypothetical protein